MDRRVLGKGLAALIPEKARKDDQARVENLRIDKIRPSQYQPREEFDDQKLSELVSSIKEKGVIQPILVRASDDGYELIAGERRLRAAKTLGMESVPALIRDVDDVDMIGLALIENIQREELNPIEEAHAYQRLMDEFDFTQDRIGQVVGKNNTTISNALRLLALPGKIQEYLSSGVLSVGHAKVLLSLSSSSTQLEFSRKVLRSGLSVRALEKLIGRKRSFKRKPDVDYNLKSIEEKLQHILGTKVRIIKGKKKGRIEIEYYSDGDLDRILGVLT